MSEPDRLALLIEYLVRTKATEIDMDQLLSNISILELRNWDIKGLIDAEGLSDLDGVTESYTPDKLLDTIKNSLLREHFRNNNYPKRVDQRFNQSLTEITAENVIN